MQKYLPRALSKFKNKALSIVLANKKTFLILFFTLIAGLILNSFVPKTYAQPAATPTPAVGNWVQDSEVTFVGKTGVRSREFLDWALQNYNWLCVKKTVDNRCDNSSDPLIAFWIIVRNIVYALIALFVLATAFILVITRGQNITIMRFIPRFILVIVLITLSFSLVQFIYQVNDVIQDFFLKINGQYITTKDLLYVGFNYRDFIGYRLQGAENDESAFITLVLVRLTAITYYVMTGVLIVRKIILWFFIIISPIFPLLLFYRPIRNTAKIWIGEFFRWLLYAPLFAVFLRGLVVVWKSGIPLPFDTSKVGTVVYPTAVNILLGGPGQKIFYNSATNSNSVNLSDTFALYIVALLMLWVVILLPFLLLKIFLDYLGTLSLDSNLALRTVVNRGMSFLSGPKGIPPVPPPTPPGMLQPAGQARTLPFFARKGEAVRPIQINANIQAQARESTDVLRLANLSIPRMRDIARYEASLISSDISRRNEVAQFRSNLTKIANPNTAIMTSEREKFSTVRQKLVEQQQKGNPVASSVLNASQVTSATTSIASTQAQAISKVQNIAQTRDQQINNLSQTLKNITNPQVAANAVAKDKFTKIKEKLLEEKEKGNELASTILDASEKLSSKDITEDQKTKIENEMLDKLLDEEKKGNTLVSDVLPVSPAAPKPVRTSLPSVNRVQQVSIDDYEEVRKLWVENYQSIEPPKDLSGQQVERREWVKNDIDKINQAITLLNSPEPDRVNQGMNMVANILPFLLIGGFSKSEVVAYLKAKQEAGKQVLDQMQRKEEEEESMVSTKEKKEEETKELSETMAVEEPKDPESVPENTPEPPGEDKKGDDK